ncbi:MAG TPA: fused MFS/spermidine synthase [Streptosporangiaceae bacterium]
MAGVGVELLRDLDRANGWMLLVDGIPQSYVDLDDPEYLEFEYVRRLGHVIDTAAPGGEPLRVLHLGAGGLTLARYVAATRPGSSQLAVDNDAALVDLVRANLPLSRNPGSRKPRSRNSRIRVRIGDARQVLSTLRPSSFDMVIADVFAAGSTPASMTSAEFVTAVRNVLRTDGVFAANVADGGPLMHVRAQVATVGEVFSRLGLIGDTGVLRGRRFGNLIVVASPRELPIPALTRRAAADPMPTRVVDGEDLTRFASGAKPVNDTTATPSPAPPPDVFTR